MKRLWTWSESSCLSCRQIYFAAGWHEANQPRGLPVQAPAAAQYIMHDNPAECTAACFTRNRLTGVYIKRCPVGASPQHRLDTRLSLDAWDGELSDWERHPCASGVAGNLPINLCVIIKAWIVKASYAHPFALSWAWCNIMKIVVLYWFWLICVWYVLTTFHLTCNSTHSECKK